MRRSILLSMLLAAVLGVWSGPAAADGPEYRLITFPVVGSVRYSDDFGDCRAGCARAHEGNDVLGSKMLPLVAAVSGTVTSLRADSSGSTGNMITITDDEGWSVTYMHVNNDSPGTDDNANPREHAFAPGIAPGVRVTAGQTIAYMGDSGNAEGSTAHVHFEMRRPEGSAFSPYTSLRLAQAPPAIGMCAIPTNPIAEPNAAANRGYWAVDAAGAVFAYGAAPYLGGLNRAPGHTPVVALAPTPTGAGYWIVDAAGSVATFGDAVNHGSLAKLRLDAPIIAITPTSTGRGYWLLANDGGIFAFGDAMFHGSAGAMTLNAPIVSMASTPTGDGYWLLGADGGIFDFGDATFHGSTATTQLAAPIVGIAPTSTGGGYWLLGRDGGVFSFGDAAFTGSIPGTGMCQPPTAGAMTASETGKGYWVLTTGGDVLTFGDTAHHGAPGTSGARAIGLAALPAQ